LIHTIHVYKPKAYYCGVLLTIIRPVFISYFLRQLGHRSTNCSTCSSSTCGGRRCRRRHGGGSSSFHWSTRFCTNRKRLPPCDPPIPHPIQRLHTILPNLAMKGLKPIKGLFPYIRILSADIAQIEACRTKVDVIFELNACAFDARTTSSVGNECTKGLTRANDCVSRGEGRSNDGGVMSSSFRLT
jgi:hypothetical protein